jgi:transposase
MADYQLLAELLGLPNGQVVGYQIINAERIEVRIESRLDAALCPHCQQVSTQMHDTAEPQMLRDLAIWGRECWLRYAPRRFACATCDNTFVERVAWREPGLAHTLRYAQHIYTRAQHEDIAQVALDEGLSQDTVRGIFERWAKKRSTSAAIRL